MIPSGRRRPLFQRLSESVTPATLGVEIGLSVAIGALIGYWLDGLLKTGPWLTILFLLFGVGAGFKRLLEAVRVLQETNGEEEDESKE